MCNLKDVRRILLLLFMVPAAGGTALVACGTSEGWVYTCIHPDHPIPGDIGPDGKPDPCHRQDAGADTDPSKCPAGACKTIPAGWDGPYLFWSGPKGQEPSCPYDAPYGEAHHAYDGLIAPLACEGCTCGTPHGSCALSSMLTAHDVLCQDLDKPHKDTPFDAQAPWGGTCDNMNPIGAGSGVKSLSIAPLTVVDEEACAPGMSDPSVPALTARVVPHDWKTFALACHGYGWGQQCEDSRSTCLPKTTRMIADFHDVCIFSEGIKECALGPWLEKHVFYDDVEDDRACSECTCGPPMGGMCTSTLSVYENNDNTCSGPVVVGQLPISSSIPGCFNIAPPGKAMGSKSATPPDYIPGACQPRGDPIAGRIAKAINPVTFCCLPQDFP